MMNRILVVVRDRRAALIRDPWGMSPRVPLDACEELVSVSAHSHRRDAVAMMRRLAAALNTGKIGLHEAAAAAFEYENGVRQEHGEDSCISA